jgi:ketosteroid isomerase-like protein
MRRLPAVICLLLFLSTELLFGAGRSESTHSKSAEPKFAIEQILRQQVEAWNRHDLETFMQGYWHSPHLTFFAGGKVNRGWDAALERYRKEYQSQGREMGRLEFADLNMEILGSDAAFVRGAYRLTMAAGKRPHGIFTLVFRKFPQGWRIIHDHTSAAPN